MYTILYYTYIVYSINCISTMRIYNHHDHQEPSIMQVQGVFSNWYPPKTLKYGKPRLGVSTLT